MNTSNPFRHLSVFAAGAAHIDRRGRSVGAFRPGASNPGRMFEAVGGAVFNAVRAARALGADIRVVSPRGGDGDAARVEEALAQLGVEDIAQTWLDRRTPTYTALLDANGDLVGGLADMELYDVMRPRLFDRRSIREALDACDIVLLDANLPAATIERLIERAEAKPVFAIGVSPAKVVRLAPVAHRFSALFLSRVEAASLVGSVETEAMATIAARLIEAGCERTVVTDGAGPAAILTDGAVWRQFPSPIEAVRDVTGAGDTLAAVAMLAFASGHDFRDAVRYGMSAASLHISAGRRDGDFTFDEITAAAASLPPTTRLHSDEPMDIA